MELELRSVEVQGAHEIGGCALQEGRPPLSRGQAPSPLVYFFCPIILINSKNDFLLGALPTLVARVWVPSGISSAQYFSLFPKITSVEFQDFWSCAE